MEENEQRREIKMKKKMDEKKIKQTTDSNIIPESLEGQV